MAKAMVFVFMTSLLLGAALLFAVQPLFGKMALPLLGGAPGVWNTLMVLFQALLLMGYGYAHLLARTLAPKYQLMVHGLLLTLALVWLPLALPHWTAPDGPWPMGWVLALGMAAVGVPFFILSATAPLLQHWFARTGHPHAHDPYFLYAASNIGSLVGLLGYPFVAEPLLTLSAQKLIWSGLFIVCATGVLVCGWQVRNRPAVVDDTKPPASPGKIIYWMALAFGPSALMLGVTTLLTNSLVATPLLWVLPLGLYLGSFIVAFSQRGQPLVAASIHLAPLALVVLALLYIAGLSHSLWILLAHLAVLALLSTACHGTLHAHRPHHSSLTVFYLAMSVGGVLGGIFNALIAPVVFPHVYEYPLSLLACAALLPVAAATWPQKLGRWAGDVIAALIGVAAVVFSQHRLVIGSVALGADTTHNQALLTAFLMVVAAALSISRAQRAAALCAAVVAMGLFYPTLSPNHEMTRRSFFSIYSVAFNPDKLRYELRSAASPANQGAQNLDPATRYDPTTFYPLDGVNELPLLQAKEPMGVIGLGVGVVACLPPQDTPVIFYEIDPLVTQIATESGFFDWVNGCPAQSTITHRDGRLALEEAVDNTFGTLVLDAFSGLTIPAHLLTTQAFDIYLHKLAPHGVLLVNITNRHMDLEPLLAALARDKNLILRSRVPDDKLGSRWVALARQDSDFGPLAQNPLWPRSTVRPLKHAWRDGFASPLPLLWRHVQNH